MLVEFDNEIEVLTNRIDGSSRDHRERRDIRHLPDISDWAPESDYHRTGSFGALSYYDYIDPSRSEQKNTVQVGFDIAGMATSHDSV